MSSRYSMVSGVVISTSPKIAFFAQPGERQLVQDPPLFAENPLAHS